MYSITMRPSTITKGLILTLIGGCIIAVPGSVFPIAALTKLLLEVQNAPIPVRIPEESDPEKVRRSMYNLKKNKYIKIKQVGKEKYRFELTKKGKKLLGRYNFSDFKIGPKEFWDGQWRTFMFDIPEKKKQVRDMLREKLKGLGFFLFQKSVWLYPLECEEEMNYICEFLGVEAHTIVFTGKIRDDHSLRKHFIHKGVLRKRDLYLT
jgi:DNA-binding transcriptional regulator PaaX